MSRKINIPSRSLLRTLSASQGRIYRRAAKSSPAEATATAKPTEAATAAARKRPPPQPPPPPPKLLPPNRHRHLSNRSSYHPRRNSRSAHPRSVLTNRETAVTVPGCDLHHSSHRQRRTSGSCRMTSCRDRHSRCGRHNSYCSPAPLGLFRPLVRSPLLVPLWCSGQSRHC